MYKFYNNWFEKENKNLNDSNIFHGLYNAAIHASCDVTDEVEFESQEVQP